MAMPAPIPRLAPVTRATFPFKLVGRCKVSFSRTTLSLELVGSWGVLSTDVATFSLELMGKVRALSSTEVGLSLNLVGRRIACSSPEVEGPGSFSKVGVSIKSVSVCSGGGVLVLRLAMLILSTSIADDEGGVYVDEGGGGKFLLGKCTVITDNPYPELLIFDWRYLNAAPSVFKYSSRVHVTIDRSSNQINFVFDFFHIFFLS